MRYAEGGEGFGRGKTLILLGLVLVAVLIIVMIVRARPRTDQDIADELETYPQIHETIAALRTYYPRDHARLTETLNDVEQRLGRQAVPGETGSFVRDFLMEKAEAIGSAPDADLRALAQADLTAAQALQRIDARLCAGFLGDGIPRSAELPDAAMAQIDHVTALRLRTAFNGERSRVMRSRTLNPADAGLLLARLEVDDPAAAALLRSGQLERSAPAEQCRAGIAIIRAAITLPPEQAGRFLGRQFRAAAEARP